jgi:hypothetical protein
MSAETFLSYIAGSDPTGAGRLAGKNDADVSSGGANSLGETPHRGWRDSYPKPSRLPCQALSMARYA